MTEPKDSDLIMRTFSVDPIKGVWIERNGKTVRGTRPEWLDWPMHTAADMAREAWNPKVKRGD